MSVSILQYINELSQLIFTLFQSGLHVYGMKIAHEAPSFLLWLLNNEYSLKFFTTSLHLWDEQLTISQSHPLNKLAILLASINLTEQSFELMVRVSQIDDFTIRRIFPASTDNERLDYLKKIRRNKDLLLSLLVSKKLFNSTDIKQQALDLVLRRKSLTAAALSAQNKALFNGRYSHLKKDFEKFNSLSESLIEIIKCISETSTSNDRAALEEKYEELVEKQKEIEKKLAKLIPEIRLTQELKTANCHNVAEELPEGAILIEYVRFELFNFQKQEWEPAHYLAFVLPAKQPDKVQIVELGSADYINNLVHQFRRSLSPGDNYQYINTEKTNEYQNLGLGEPTAKPLVFNPKSGFELFQKVFFPLLSAFNSSKYLIIAPDCDLNLIPFQTLPLAQQVQTYLIDEYLVSYLSVGRDILRFKNSINCPCSPPVVLADPDFNLAAESENLNSQSAKDDNCEFSLLKSIKYPLERAIGTDFLGKKVAKQLGVSPCLGSEALELYLKTYESPKILLIATHGVFFNFAYDQQADKQTLLNSNSSIKIKPKNKMRLSGLALAGANTWLTGGKLPKEAGNGVLFSQDVASLDLFGNDLTVLSACNSGIGTVHIGEGVFGIRRAFSVAGTDRLLMSLWSVPARATTMLIGRFFENLQSGDNQAEALQKAQNYIRTITYKELSEHPFGAETLKELQELGYLKECKDETRPLEHPRFWGAWICQGNTAPLNWSSTF